MKKLMTVGCVLVSAFAAFADTPPPPYEDYIYLTESDSPSGTKASEGSWHSGLHWSDGQAPHTDANYYVPAGLRLRTQCSSKAHNFDWEGGKLVIGGMLRLYVSGSGGYGPEIADMTLLDGSIVEFSTVYSSLCGTTSKITVLASADTPAAIRLVADKGNQANRRIYSYFVGDVGTGLCFDKADGVSQPATFITYKEGAFANFLGTLTVKGEGVVFKPASSSYGFKSFGGNVVVTDGAMLSFSGGKTYSGVPAASLEVTDGGIMNFGFSATYGTQGTLDVTNSLRIAEGGIARIGGIGTANFGDVAKLDPAGRRFAVPIVRLSGDAAATEPDIDGARFDWISSSGVPIVDEETAKRLGWKVFSRNNEDGTKTVYLGATNAVATCKGADTFVFNAGKDSSWIGTSGVPTPGTDLIFGAGNSGRLDQNDTAAAPYFEQGHIIFAGYYSHYIRANMKNLYFGKSLDVWNGQTGWIVYHSANRRMYGGPLTLHDGARFTLRPMNGGKDYAVGLRIEQEIHGNGTLDIFTYGKGASNRVDLAGINTNWHGQLVIRPFCDNPTDNGKYIHCNTQVTNALAWGGSYLADENTYSAVTFSNNPCVHVPNDVCFNEPTRGFFLCDTPRFKVAEGAKLTLSNKVTYSGIVEKMGAGVLNLGGTARFEDGQSETAPVDGRCGLVVSGGALEVSSQEAVDGLQVLFAAGTKLVVGKDCGFYNVKSSNPLTIAGEKLQVEITGFDAQPKEDTEVTVLTLSEAAAANIDAERFEFPSTKTCKVTSFEKRPAADGKVEYVATVAGYKGLYLLFKYPVRQVVRTPGD